MESVGFNIYAVGTGVEYSVNKLVEEILKITNENVNIIHESLPVGDALRSSADSSFLKKIGWESKIDIIEGLRLTWKYFTN